MSPDPAKPYYKMYYEDVVLALSDSILRNLRIRGGKFKAWRKNRRTKIYSAMDGAQAKHCIPGIGDKQIFQFVFGGWEIEEGIDGFHLQEIRKFLEPIRLSAVTKIFLVIGVNSLR